MSFRAAGGTAICVPVNRLCFRDGVDLVREVADIGLALDSKSFRVLLGVHLMMQAGVVGLVVIDVIKKIHDKTFPLDGASF